MRYKSVFIIFLLLLTFVSKGQKNSTTSNYLLVKANGYYQNLDYSKAINFFQRYQQTDKGKKDTLIMVSLGDCYWKLKEYKKAHECYQVLFLKKDFVITESIRFRMAEYEASQQNYSKATALLNGLSGFQEKANGFGQMEYMLRDSLDFVIHNLKINTNSYRELAPTSIGSKLFFSTNQPENLLIPKVATIDGKQFFHLKQLLDTTASASNEIVVRSGVVLNFDSAVTKNISRKIALSFDNSDNALLTRTNMFADKINSNKVNKNIRSLTQPITGISAYKFYNVTNFSYLATSNKVYFTVNKEKPSTSAKGLLSKHTLQIAEADLADLSLKNIVFLPLGIDSNFSLMHPAIHPNGNLLVFSSDQSDKQFDLYYSIKDSSEWSKPKAIEKLNTKGEEVFPSFSADGTLYFSSNGKAGLGGLDIYAVKLAIVGGDEKVEHLSYPLNSSHDDFGYTSVQKNANMGYFSSNRNGSDDIFSFEKKPFKIKIDGFVLNDSTRLRKKGVTVSLMEDLGNGQTKIIDSLVTNTTGNYTFLSRPNRKYVVSFKDSQSDAKELFVNNNGAKSAKSLPIVSLKSREVINNISVVVPKLSNNTVNNDLGTSKVVNLGVSSNNPASQAKILDLKFVIYYELNNSALDTKDIFVLDSLIRLLKTNDKLNVVIGSFADCEGSDFYNMMLSNKRSKATSDYLMAKGVNKYRIIASNYGESYLYLDCDTNKYDVVQQLLNRRTEIFVTLQKNLLWLDINKQFPKSK